MRHAGPESFRGCDWFSVEVACPANAGFGRNQKQPECMDTKWKSTVNRSRCELTGTKSARVFHELVSFQSK
jgi:hypothetical protein